MPAPDPIWGLHIAPGAIAGALVRTAGDGFEVLDTFVALAPSDPEGLREAASDVARRPGVFGRASLAALPDHELAVGTGNIPSDELYLNDDEIYHHLHDFAPFEPGEGQILYRPVGRSDARRYLVAAVPPWAQEELEGFASTLAEEWHGLALATPCLVRGARALGIVDGRTFLVDLQATMTTVVVVDGEEERRYLVPSGLAAADSSMDAAQALGADLVRVLAYHAEVALRESPGEGSGGSHDVYLVGAHAARARELLARSLGGRLAEASRCGGRAERITDASGRPLRPDVRLTHAGSIGAAIEAFTPGEHRFVLRHPPEEVPEYVEPTGAGRAGGAGALAARVVGGAAALAVVAGGAWVLLGRHPRSGDGEGGPIPTVRGGTGALTEDERAAADRARTALDALAHRVAHGRALVAACAALASSEPRPAARSFEIEELRGALRATLVADVDGSISPEIRSAARKALEGLPGIEQVGIDVQDGGLRVRFRTGISETPDAGEGERVALAALTAFDGAMPGVPTDASGRPLLGRDAAAALLAPADPGGGRSAPRLTSAETARALELLLEARDLLARVPAAPPPTAPELSVDAAGSDGTVTLVTSLPGDTAQPVARRRLPSGEWTVVGELAAGETTFADDVPGASGRYAWRVGEEGTAVTAQADVRIDVDVELVGVEPASGLPRFRLARSWRGAVIEEECAPVPDAPLRAEHEGVVLDPGLTFVGSTPRTETETVTVGVPELLPDGRVRRDAAGRPVLVERPVERSYDVVEVRARDAQGAVRTWLRKMTDG